ncbi:polyphosphate kinase 2 [Phenylobacterium hankyongense]|uniref:ADP/GDP-polyphosphate phosphotransferase n=1 Tax=Phenylobacterium hankyongense TaxID=1813876 RepID=A0A328AY44_9CAUL|nr:polyphosphate kinase 2 [Phenylobacterium hankyongense]RAK60032.1 polyphosphate kinase 2 [Phenylobacterium hankyongense]
MSKDDDLDELEQRQLALVHWQQHAMAEPEKVLVIFEGRDAAGKDGAIRAVTEHLSVRNTRVVALAKPSDQERSQWYFQRYVARLPAGGETVIFNRSWYNRAGVERVMGFSTAEEQEVFLREVPGFEAMLLESGLKIVKFWLDVSKSEQAKRLEQRRTDPLKVMKSSPLDAAAQEKWDAYTDARDEMLRRTSTPAAPWICVRGDHKKAARLAIISHLVHALAPPAIAREVAPPDPDVLFQFELAALTDGRLEH